MDGNDFFVVSVVVSEGLKSVAYRISRAAPLKLTNHIYSALFSVCILEVCDQSITQECNDFIREELVILLILGVYKCL